jgi:hypothetical protein
VRLIDRDHVALNCTIVIATVSVCDRPPATISCAVVEVQLHPARDVRRGFGLDASQIVSRFVLGILFQCFALIDECELLSVADDQWLPAGIVLSSVLVGLSSVCALGCLGVATITIILRKSESGSEAQKLVD